MARTFSCKSIYPVISRLKRVFGIARSFGKVTAYTSKNQQKHLSKILYGSGSSGLGSSDLRVFAPLRLESKDGPISRPTRWSKQPDCGEYTYVRGA